MVKKDNFCRISEDEKEKLQTSHNITMFVALIIPIFVIIAIILTQIIVVADFLTVNIEGGTTSTLTDTMGTVYIGIGWITTMILSVIMLIKLFTYLEKQVWEDE